jgi:hypothetical protein
MLTRSIGAAAALMSSGDPRARSREILIAYGAMRLRTVLNIAFAAFVLFVVAACGGSDGGGGDVILPMLTRVSPDRGPLAGGTTVTLTVSSFADSAPSTLAVSFGTRPATNVKLVDATTITCVTPAATAAGAVDVTVSNDGDSFSLEKAFRYDAGLTLADLTITSVSPATAPTGTTQPVTVTGTGFDTSVPATVGFGSLGATNVTVVDATTITATAPSSTTAGVVAVNVTQGGRTASLANAFTYFTGAARLAFVNQPTNANVGSALAAFAVRLEDASGAPVTSQGGTVTLTATHPAGVPASGTLSAAVTNGVASFANVSFDHGGKGVTLTASAPGLTSATSATFDITATLPSGSGRVFGTTGARLLAFDGEDLGDARLDLAITGLQGGETIDAIDFRPATGQLYGVGSTGRLYTISTSTGAATQVGNPLVLTGSPAIDFDPTSDRLRISTTTRENLRVVPDTGAVAANDTNLAYAAGDPNGGQTPDLRKNAHSRNFAGATTTALYGIDPTLDVLVKQDPPNAGTLTTVGSLGLNATVVRGFDVVGNDHAVAVMTNAGGATQLYRINLSLGTATAVAGQDVASTILDVAVEPSTIVLATSTNVLLTVSSARPAAVATATPITGLQANETIVGMDFSPARNELFAVGSTSRLYRVDPSTAVATGIGSVFGTMLNGAAFGVDVNPATGNVFVTSDTGQNLSIDSATGVVTAGTALAGGGLVGLAATPNAQGATPTFLGIDSATDRLMSVDVATGARTDLGALGTDVNATASLDATPLGTIYGTTLRAGATAHDLVTINPATGALSVVRDLPTPLAIAAMAIPALASPRPRMVLYDATSNELQLMDVAGVRSSTIAVTGMMANFAIVAIDFRPSTGVLYALAFSFAAVGQEGALYTVNTDTGVATLVGARFPMPNAIGSTLNAVTRFGFDFDPVTDLLRVVSTGRDNFRLHPTTGAVTPATILTPSGTTGVGAAYTGNANAAATTLYGLNASTSQLVVIGGDTGAATAVGSLGVTVSAEAGFDIGSSGAAYAVFETGGTWGVYRINLASGAASLRFNLPGSNTRRGLALFR